MSRIVQVIEAADRNNPDAARSHLYAETSEGHYWPYCDYGWNRSNGSRLSILRGWSSNRGTCKLCKRTAAENPRKVVTRARPHKTKWL